MDKKDKKDKKEQAAKKEQAVKKVVVQSKNSRERHKRSAATRKCLSRGAKIMYANCPGGSEAFRIVESAEKHGRKSHTTKLKGEE